MLKLLGHGLAVVLLTVVTQIGGVIYLLALLLRRLFFRTARRQGLALLALFLACYSTVTLAASLGAVPSERVALSCTARDGKPLVMASPLFCALNRHYVSPEMRDLAEALAEHMVAEFPGTITNTLDGNFLLLEGFPLLPHLSHDDGRKLDLAFYYQGTDGTYRSGSHVSPLGYWGFEEARPGEPQPCSGGKDLISLRWDMAWWQPLNRDDLMLEEERTKAALNWLTTEGKRYGIERILLEPHLKYRLGLTSNMIRFQGCRAARHDDHIHIQIR